MEFMIPQDRNSLLRAIQGVTFISNSCQKKQRAMKTFYKQHSNVFFKFIKSTIFTKKKKNHKSNIIKSTIN